MVKEKTATDLVCVVEAGGQVSDHKGCNIPSGNISLDVITEKDKNDLAFIAKLDPGTLVLFITRQNGLLHPLLELQTM